MWMSFKTNSETGSKAHAVKISVGGINALTGLPMGDPSAGKQDYLAINDENGQLCVAVIIFEPYTFANPEFIDGLCEHI